MTQQKDPSTMILKMPADPRSQEECEKALSILKTNMKIGRFALPPFAQSYTARTLPPALNWVAKAQENERTLLSVQWHYLSAEEKQEALDGVKRDYDLAAKKYGMSDKVAALNKILVEQRVREIKHESKKPFAEFLYYHMFAYAVLPALAEGGFLKDSCWLTPDGMDLDVLILWYDHWRKYVIPNQNIPFRAFLARLPGSDRSKKKEPSVRPKLGQKLRPEHIAFIQGAGLAKTKAEIANDFQKRFDFTICEKTIQKYRKSSEGGNG